MQTNDASRLGGRSPLRKVLLVSVAVVALVGAALAFPIEALAAPASGLSAIVEGPRFVARGELPVVKVTVFNDSDDVGLVAWQTPFRGVDGNIFDVRRDGQPVAYIGALYKFAAPEVEDYVHIPRGNSRKVDVDLSRYYDFSRAGEYTVQYRVALRDAMGNDAPGLLSNVALMSVESDDRRKDGTSLSPQPNSKPVKGPPCDQSQLASLETAKSNATDYSAKAHDYLLTNNADTLGLYKTWFDASGAEQGWSTVLNNFDKINWAFTTQNVTFNCKCNQNVYAYVYPNKPYEITVCRAFWTAPDVGRDSKAGTLVHEMSHFNTTASTNDWVYGETACMSLAETDWTKAIDNADSHEYFAEHQP